MTTLTEIETAIRQLPEHEIRTLLTRLHIYLDDLITAKFVYSLGECHV